MAAPSGSAGPAVVPPVAGAVHVCPSAPIPVPPPRTPAVALAPGLRGFAPDIQSYPNGVALVQAIRNISALRPDDSVDIVPWDDLSTIGVSCVMSLESKEWVREVIQRIPIQPKTIFMFHRAGRWDATQNRHQVETGHLLIDQLERCWTRQVDSWANEHHRANPRRDEIQARMLTCLRVNADPADRFVELAMFSPM